MERKGTPAEGNGKGMGIQVLLKTCMRKDTKAWKHPFIQIYAFVTVAKLRLY